MNVEEKHAVGANQVEADTARSEREQHNSDAEVRWLVECLHDAVALGHLDVASYFAVFKVDFAQIATDYIEHGGPLRDNYNLVARVLFEDLLYHVDYLLKFGALIATLHTFAKISVAFVY